MWLFLLLLGYVIIIVITTTKYSHCESTTWPFSLYTNLNYRAKLF